MARCDCPINVPKPEISQGNSEYSALMGQGGGQQVQKTGFPTLTQMGQTIYKQLSDPFYDNGPNDKGIGIQLAYSLARVGLGFFLAMLVAIPFGFLSECRHWHIKHLIHLFRY